MNSPTRGNLAEYIPMAMWTLTMFNIQAQISTIESIMERSDRPEELESRRRSFVKELSICKMELLDNERIYAAALAAFCR